MSFIWFFLLYVLLHTFWILCSLLWSLLNRKFWNIWGLFCIILGLINVASLTCRALPFDSCLYNDDQTHLPFGPNHLYQFWRRVFPTSAATAVKLEQINKRSFSVSNECLLFTAATSAKHLSCHKVYSFQTFLFNTYKWSIIFPVIYDQCITMFLILWWLVLVIKFNKHPRWNDLLKSTNDRLWACGDV